MARPALTFWGMVGAVMVALKLKERYDDYNTLPNEEEGLGHGPVALTNANPNTDEDAADGTSLLDTQLPATARSNRRKKADCCVCCGMRCGLFWKAFGIVLLLLLGWQAVRLVVWAVKPKPTGLEGMPEFSTSLGCMAKEAQHIYKGARQDISMPVGKNQNKGDHSADFKGGAVGTILIVQGEEDLQDIKYEISVRSNNAALLDQVVIDYPTPEKINDNTESSRLRLTTPSGIANDGCMRFDVTLYLPQTVKTMHIQTHATTHVKFAPDSNFNFENLFVTMYQLDDKSLLLPSEGVHARKMRFQMSGGFLYGDLTVADEATLDTQSGRAAVHVRVHPAPSSAEPPAPVKVHSSTGAGRTDVFFVTHAGLAHRPIDASHYSSMNGELYLTYTDAAFNGTVDLAAKSFSASGLENAFKQDGGLPYVGSRAGVDKMTVRSQGWVGLYF